MVQRSPAMASLPGMMAKVLVLGILLTCSHAATATDLCTVTPANETTQCANITRLTTSELFRVLIANVPTCSVSIQRYACAESSLIDILPGGFFVGLGKCFNNESVLSLDPQISVLMFSRQSKVFFDASIQALKDEFANYAHEWNAYLLYGLWARLIQETDMSDAAALKDLFQVKMQPFLSVINTTTLTCLLQKNVSCQGFQEVVKGLDTKYSEMSHHKRQDIYRVLYSFLSNQLNVTGSACFSGGNSSLWVQQNFMNFARVAKLDDFAALNKNVNVVDILPFFSVPQLVDFTLKSGALNDTALMTSVTNQLQTLSEIQDYITRLQEAAKGNNQTLSPEVQSLLMNRSIQILSTQFPHFTPKNWTDLFQGSWNLAVHNVSAARLSLIPKNITCESYQAIIKVANDNYANMSSEKQKMFYDVVIKPYLSQNGLKPKCLNVSDPTQNSTDWFVKNLGSYLTYTHKDDLHQFANESDLQALASNPANVQLVNSLNLSKEMDRYYTQLLTSTPGVNLSSIPGKFVCFLSPTALQNVNAQQALGLAQLLSENCLSVQKNGSTNETIPTPPTPEELQIAVSLVNKLNNFSVDTVKTLGPAVVGLSPSQIETGFTDEDLEACLPDFAKTPGWSPRQSSSILDKLTKAGQQFPSLQTVGRLLNGFSLKQLQHLSPETLLSDLKNGWVQSQLSNAAPAVQNTIVSKIASISSSPVNLIQNIPSALVGYIPKALLLFKNEKPNVPDLNTKSWNPDQASMFAGDLVKSGASIPSLSPNVLQGFTCADLSSMDLGTVKQVAQAMKEKGAHLNENQLSCLAKTISIDGIPSNTSIYPQDLLLFSSSASLSTPGGCKEHFRQVGGADVNILPVGSPQRKRLLSDALACLNISGTNVTAENAQVLGHLACDLNGAYISDSAMSLLPVLSKCKSFTADQESAIQMVIASGKTQFGSPSQWTAASVSSLGSLLFALSPDTIKQIPRPSLITWLRNAAQNPDVPKEQVNKIIKLLVPTNIARSTVACPDGMAITADNVKDPLLPIYYTAAQLNACLDDKTLVDFLSDLGGKAFTNEQLDVLKERLDQLFPAGYPENLLPSLGAITFRVNETDIKKWNITSAATLQSLLAIGPPNNLASTMIVEFTSSGNTLNAVALNAIGSNYLCLLNDTQLNSIEPTDIRNAQALDTSACNQSVKDVMYNKAKLAFQDSKDSVPGYYNLIKPYLGGAPAEDIKVLAKQNISMDINTLIGLKPSTVMNLTVDDMKGLLGLNLNDLKDRQNEPILRNWINSQSQADLDKLGLGLQTGAPPQDATSSTAPSSTAPSTVTTPPSNVTTTNSTNQTTNAGYYISANTGFIFGFLHLGVLLAFLQ